MCDTCGCNITPGNKHLVAEGGKLEVDASGKKVVDVMHSLLHENDHQAEHNRHHFNARGILAINLMSSPGSGKTALLEATIDALKDKYNIAVIEGDLETENDAERIRAKNIPAIQIATGTACHLDAHMVHDALHNLDLQNIDLVFIENVGNLVCPASFDLGHHLNVTLLSSTEGDDKPAKYPVMFKTSDLLLITKADLLPLLDDFDTARAEKYFRNLANQSPIFTLSATKNIALDNWLDWINEKIQAHRKNLAEHPVDKNHMHHSHDHHSHHHHHI
ncbi:MAG: hydrogenase nickel incorporation protein HypB [Gammaproteobacteria bacterium]|nr:hydrogenase nickel incorporation protein HypB [Gammaproteobacteria bacterium]